MREQINFRAGLIHAIVWLLLVNMQAGASDDVADCGKVLREPNGGYSIVVSCHSLSAMSRARIRGVVEAALQHSPRRTGDAHVIFLSAESIKNPKCRYLYAMPSSKNCGDALIGVYQTGNGFLVYLSEHDGQWHEVNLGLSEWS